MDMNRKKPGVTRRQFLGGAAATAGLLILPRYMLGDQPSTMTPSNRVNTALVGKGTRGKQQTAWSGFISCDVDKKAGADYQDYRKMLDEKGKDIDALLIATPDHTHAVIAMEAIRRGKHVYVEKPLAHSIGEIRALSAAAKEHKVVTQLGNQGHSYDSCAQCVEWIRDGAIGTVKEVHCGHSGGSAIKDLDKLKEQYPIPDGMDWDLWIGPAAYRGFNPMFHPHNWRNWAFFGTGAAGDWTCHCVDPAFWALELQYPTSVEVTVDGYDPKLHADVFAPGKCAKFEFPAKGDRGPITLYWRDGSAKWPRPEGLEAGRNTPGEGGVVVGTEGGITYGVWGAGDFRVFPETRLKAYLESKPGYMAAKGPPKTIKRVSEHHKDFAEAIREGRPAGSDFANYGGPLTEVALLSIIGMRFPGQKLLWDGPNAKFTNNEEANKMVNPPYRDGWKL
jgi:predicted dehydrogenase